MAFGHPLSGVVVRSRQSAALYGTGRRRMTSVRYTGVRKARLMATQADGSPTDTDSSEGQNPKVPEGFEVPEPRPFYVRPDKLADILRGSVGSAVRLGSGALVSGYTVRQEDGRLVEASSTLPSSRPRMPLELYEFEACPFCRKVREAMTMLDLDVYVYPAPKNGVRFRPQVIEMGGKAQFPYLVDPNTDFKGYESDDIIQYLFKTYGSGRVPLTLAAGPLTSLSSGLASLAKASAGGTRATKTVFPSLPLELWSYEASPFCKNVREKLAELELPYLLHNTARGSQNRKALKERVGRFQVPYIEDPNTGVKMFESAEIVEYLTLTYGPSAPGASTTLPEGLRGISPKVIDVVAEADQQPEPAMESDSVESTDAEGTEGGSQTK